MLTFDDDNRRFTYRTVGILIHQGKVLLQSSPDDDYWALPGGRVEHGESALESLVREIKEEMDVVATSTRPLWIVDNHFEEFGMVCHELGMYCEVTVDPDSYIYSASEFEGVERDKDLIFRWFELAEIGETELYPAFLRQSLLNLPDELQYICHRDDT
ncbi:MAG: NUDIX domain-containing protein [Pseudomonadales bacterium]|nr:NUDIX domain-containing protein [Pseudomonadales bacterium]